MRWEKYGTRDLSYSNWHRHALPDRATYIDIDGVEYCRRCRVPLAIIETARDVGQPHKATTVINRLAASIDVEGGCVALCVLYLPDPECENGIRGFRVREVYPDEQPFGDMTPGQFAAYITKLHDDHEYGGGCPFNQKVG